MLLQMNCMMWIMAVVVLATAKPPPSTDLWAPSFINTGFPPTASKINSITVPYMPKSSAFFPKFVDPKTMISKKTDMLANFFGALEPVDPLNDFLHYPAATSVESPKSFNGFSSSLDPRFFDANANSGISPRGIIENEDTGTKTLGSPPPYPGLAPIAEEPDSSESKSSKEYGKALPPNEKMPSETVGAFYPSAGATEIPIPKSTIVPADFWLPSSIVPGPMEYNNKVSVFLDKLFDSLALNKTAPMAGQTVSRSVNEDEPMQEKNVASRSAVDVKTIAAAKDSIVESILSELGDLKGDMVDTLNDVIAYRKSVSPASSTGKPFKPVSPFAAFFAPSTMDPFLPFKQRISVLSHVFEMLTELEHNITATVQNAIGSSTDVPFLQDPTRVQTDPITTNFSMANSKTLNDPSMRSDSTVSSFNATLMDVIKSRLASIGKTSGTESIEPMVSNDFQKTEKLARSLPKHASSFWGAFSRSDPYTSGRDVERRNDKIIDYTNYGERDPNQYKRMVPMNMRQGYQNVPPATLLESFQAGDGFLPMVHQGSGMKHQQKTNEESSKWLQWIKYLQSEIQGRKNHHNHH